RWATKARLVRERDRWSGHGPRTCPSQPRRPWKPTNARTSARRSRARASRKSMPGIARLLWGQRRGVRTGSARAVPETLLIERFALAQHVVDCPPQPRRQDRQRLALAALRRLLLLPLLGALTGAQEQARRLGEGPAQVGVADLLATGAQLFAARFMGATHQPGVRQKLPGRVEAPDGMRLVEQDQRQHLADPGNAPQPVEGLHVVHLGRA